MQLPDGRVQIVSYEADDYGFRPTVHYEYPGGEPHQALDVVGPPPHHHPGTAKQRSQLTANVLNRGFKATGYIDGDIHLYSIPKF